MALDFLSSTKKKLIDMSAALAGGSQAADPQVEMFESRLTELLNVISALRVDLARYAESMLAAATQSSKVGMEFADIYRHSEARQKSLMTFSDTMREVESHAAEIWAKQFNYEVLSLLDQWKDRIGQLIKRSRSSQKMYVKIAQASQSKAESPAALSKMQHDYENSKNELKDMVKKHLESRYTVLDAILVRLMELQIEYTSKSSATVSVLEKNVQSYRSRFPKGSIPEILQVQPDANADKGPAASDADRVNRKAVQTESDDDSSEEDDDDDSGDEKAADDDKPVSKHEAKSTPATSTTNKSAVEPKNGSKPAPEPVDLLFGFNAGLMSSDNKTKSDNPMPFGDLSGGTASAPTHSSSNSIDLLFASMPVDTTPLASFPFAANFGSNPETPNSYLFSSAPESDQTESNPKIRNLRAQLSAEENLKDAKDKAKDNVSFQLDSWEFSLGLKKKNIRTLLSTMHTVLPADMNFAPIKMADLQNAANVKKAMRRAVLCVHPDKIDAKAVNGAEKLVICERIFNAIQVEYKAFEDSGAS